MQPSPGAPGTVSKILWHFTGGPKWNAEDKRQEGEPKPPSEAYAALLGILGDRQLRLGNYREVVKVTEPIVRYDRLAGKLVREGDKIILYESAPVCCVSDIPVAHLSYHAERYGKVAVGFHRDAAIYKGFNPVFYTLHGSLALRALHLGFRDIEAALDRGILNSIAEGKTEEHLKDLRCELGHPVDTSGVVSGIADAIASFADIADIAKDDFKEFLAFVKTFDVHEFSTIYCEREWRSTSTFSFHVDDIAMVVLPNIGHESLFRKFVTESASAVRLPRAVPIVPWEDLIEP
jgi:hypothetical protein